ncbi:hypothetical protein F5Y19DRAFT_480141 [Xylariaceae sp. FL1651]|nr:hypothetical protein F5Y19DRAFT_480141 [Xylariaceae sp. FL1651]
MSNRRSRYPSRSSGPDRTNSHESQRTRRHHRRVDEDEHGPQIPEGSTRYDIDSSDDQPSTSQRTPPEWGAAAAPSNHLFADGHASSGLAVMSSWSSYDPNSVGVTLVGDVGFPRLPYQPDVGSAAYPRFHDPVWQTPSTSYQSISHGQAQTPMSPTAFPPESMASAGFQRTDYGQSGPHWSIPAAHDQTADANTDEDQELRRLSTQARNGSHGWQSGQGPPHDATLPTTRTSYPSIVEQDNGALRSDRDQEDRNRYVHRCINDNESPWTHMSPYYSR